MYRPLPGSMTQRPATYSPAHIRRQREAHAKADGYGRTATFTCMT
jgi:hypothetical protein